MSFLNYAILCKSRKREYKLFHFTFLFLLHDDDNKFICRFVINLISFQSELQVEGGMKECRIKFLLRCVNFETL